MKPLALVTNDDGIDSAFLHRLVEALAKDFEVAVAAPAFEQSWIGRAISRRTEVEVIPSPSHFPSGVQAWAVSGTPTDCVNIALGNLLDRQPDIVVSGINIGFNTTETLILCSGTIAGAMEGAQWGLPQSPSANACRTTSSKASATPMAKPKGPFPNHCRPQPSTHAK